MLKKNYFWNIYKIIFTILLVLVICTWILLWIFLTSYEAGRPTHLADEVVSMYQKKNVNRISKYVDLKDNAFNNKKTLKESIKKTINKDIKYTKKAGKYTDKKPVYSIISNNKEIGVLTLKAKSRKGLFGIKRWQIDNINPLLETKTIIINAPDDVNVTVNGRLLDNKSLDNENYLTEDLIFISNYKEIKPFLSYKIDDMYDSFEIELSSGEFNNNDNVYTYVYPEDKELLSSLQDNLIDFCYNYTRYVLKETTFASISKYVMNGTDTFTFLRGIASTNIWSGNHTPVEFSDIEFNNMEKYNDDVFKVDVKYTYKFTSSIGEQVSDANLTLYLINNNGNWQIIKLNT